MHIGRELPVGQLDVDRERAPTRGTEELYEVNRFRVVAVRNLHLPFRESLRERTACPDSSITPTDADIAERRVAVRAT